MGNDDGVAPGGPRFGSIRVQAVPPSFARSASNLVITQIRLRIIRPAGPDTILTRTLPFDINSNTISTSAQVLLTGPSETLLVALDYLDAQNTVLFSGSQLVLVTNSPSGTTTPPIIPIYQGPGLNVAALLLSPLDTSMSAGDTLIYQLSAIDASQQPVLSFYAGWRSNDPRVVVNALGQVVAPDITKLITVSVQTPNGVFATTGLTIFGSQLGIVPDSVERLPGGTQQFIVALGGAQGATYLWSVNAVNGGNATFGTITSTGFYTAPATVPSPAKFQVCATDSQNPQSRGCAVVVITATPSAGQDVIVFNDINMFSNFAIANAPLVKNLVGFTSAGPRSSGSQVIHEYSHASLCFQTGECGTAVLAPLDSIFATRGMTTLVLDTISQITNIPPQVKAIFIWTPLRAYDTTEINIFKQFASEGGRIVFLGERLPFYGSFGIDSVENRFFLEMGAQLTNVGADIALASPYTVPKAGIRASQVTTGVDSVQFDAASIVVPGPNDLPIVVDTTAAQSVLGAVAKIDVTPLPAPLPVAGPSRVGTRTRAAVKASGAAPTARARAGSGPR